MPTSIRGLASLGRYMIEVLDRDEVDVEKCAKAALATITEGLKALPVKPVAVPQHTHSAEVSLARRVVDYFGNDPIPDNMTGDIALRDCARAIVAASTVNAPGVREEAVRPDPIHALIDAHAAAYAEWERLFLIASSMRRGDPGFDAAEAAAMAADRASDQAWRDLFKTQPKDPHELWLLLAHIEKHHAAQHGMADAPDIWRTLTGAVAAMRTAEQAPKVLPHDLSKLTVPQLSSLYGICWQQRDILLAIESQPRCVDASENGFKTNTPLGDIIETEGARFAFLGDDVVGEMERRRPTSDDDRNLIIETRVRHDLNCNCAIGPELVAEIVASWGAK